MAKRHLTPSQRAQRVGDQMQRDLSDILRTHVRDPRLQHDVTIMRVDVSNDLSIADVYFAVLLNEQDPQVVWDALKGAAGALRSELAKRATTYSVPQLRFVYDSSVEHGIHLSKLIDIANATSAQDDDGENQ